jgi:hypothetical protein
VDVASSRAMLTRAPYRHARCSAWSSSAVSVRWTRVRKSVALWLAAPAATGWLSSAPSNASRGTRTRRPPGVEPGFCFLVFVVARFAVTDPTASNTRYTSEAMSTLSTDLATWEQIASASRWPSLLIGNGASVNVWERFGYPELYQTACDDDEVDKALTRKDRALFARLGSVNFEEVLSALDTAVAVGEVLGLDCSGLHERIESIRGALIDAVQVVHVPWTLIPELVLETYNRVMRAHHTVYTTNYDLLAYWGLMHNPTDFKDYLWGDHNSFDRDSTDVPDACTRVLFLHGALHLLRGFDGATWKRVAGNSNLLASFGQDAGDGVEPLVITEGSAEDKLEAIHRSDYLRFAYEEFVADREPIVIFGQGLTEQDAHLIRALSTTPHRPVAVAVRGGSPAQIIKRKAAVLKAIPGASVQFFDARSHPLGDPQLAIDPD